MKATGFLNRKLALTLDGLGHRYGTLPCQVLGIDPATGRGYVINTYVLSTVMEEQQMLTTTEGQIHAKQRTWPPEVKAELRRMGLKFG